MLEECQKACQETNACYAIYWEYNDDKRLLRPECHYTSPAHIEKIKERTSGLKRTRRAGDESFPACCIALKVTYKPGAGFVGTCYRSRDATLLTDAQDVFGQVQDFKDLDNTPLSAVSKASLASSRSSKSAQEPDRSQAMSKFYISSVAVKPFAKGVMEVGTTNRWDTSKWVDQYNVALDACRAACREVGGDYAICWGPDKTGVIREQCNWDTPENLAWVKGQTGREDLYTSDSYKLQLDMGPGGHISNACGSRKAMLLKDVSLLSESQFPRKDQAKKFGIVSVALKPFGSGVIEVGSRSKLENCKYVTEHEAFTNACKLACKESGGTYAMYWEFSEEKGALWPVYHYSPPEVVEEVFRETGRRDLYTTASYQVPAQAGQDIVGKAYQLKEARFIPDVQKLPDHAFSRKRLATLYDVVSVAVRPWARGVMEVGNSKKWETCPWVDEYKGFMQVCETACRESGSDFAMYWCLDQEGVLRPLCHWEVSARRAHETRMGAFYTTESYQVSMRSGEGMVGKAFKSKEAAFVSDIAELSKSDYLRKDQAQEFGIVSVAVKPFGRGILEVGSRTWWGSCDWVRNYNHFRQACELACQETGSDYAMYWALDEVKGSLFPQCHWDNDTQCQRVRVSFREATPTEGFATEAYRFQMKVGTGFVGKTYANREAIFVPDLAQYAEKNFVRKKIAEKFGIKSMALRPFAKGVVEVGSTAKWDACPWVQEHRLFQEACQMVCSETGCAFAIYWGPDKDKNMLSPIAHWTSLAQLAQTKAKTGTEDLYATECNKLQKGIDEGIVGRVRKSAEALWAPDVSELPRDELERKALARRFGIVSLALRPFAGGVIEAGWVAGAGFDRCSWIEDSAAIAQECRRSCQQTGASYAIYWALDQAKDVLRPVWHYDPQDDAAADSFVTLHAGHYSSQKDDAASDHALATLYVMESYKFQVKPGTSYVGRAYKSQEGIFLPNVQQTQEEGFLRKDLAERCKIISVAVKPVGRGVIELGSRVPWLDCYWVHDEGKEAVALVDSQESCWMPTFLVTALSSFSSLHLAGQPSPKTLLNL